MTTNIDELLVRIGLAAKNARLNLNNSKEEQGGIANISKNAVANIETGRNSYSSNLFAYLESVGLLDELTNSIPDPNAISPIERAALNNQRSKVKKQRPSRKKNQSTIIWGDDK